MAKLITRDEWQQERYERVRAFEESMRHLAFELGFFPVRVQIDDDQEDATLDVTIDFRMDRIKPKAVTGETIRLEEGRR